MFDFSSRYYNLPTRIHLTSTGEKIPYKKRRLLPSIQQFQPYSTITIKAGDRVDLLSSQVLGDPLLFWRLCDYNNVMHPLELIAEIGEKIHVKLPQEESMF